MAKASFFAPSCVLVAALLLSACDSASSKGDGSNNDPSVARPVMVAPVRFDERARKRTFAATIRPSIESDLGFRVSGKVAQRLVRNGDRVHKGQALLTLDANDLRLQLDQAEAEVKAAKTNLTQAEADERRATELQRKGWAANATVEKGHAVAEEARSRLIRAQRSLELALNARDYATLEADADGVITATLVEPGQVITSGQAAVRLARLPEMEAQVALPETYVEQVRNATATLSLWSLPNRTFEVRLKELSLAADPTTRTYAARFSIPDAGEALRLGMSATLTLREMSAGHSARLPLTALFDHGSGPSVWVVDGEGRLTGRRVEIDRYDDRAVLISSGVAEGERVVALGVEKLDPGLTVRAISTLTY
ncbi:efflux RND transporter periplasmic adaptor subunit [Rhodopseudomonas palustris]|uniref:efflux RND transporter periplasmic adaptor subunit n=1 Tax=Rhodopseudomonas palustris TaxID=1076 RepID=UPI003A0FEC26